MERNVHQAVKQVEKILLSVTQLVVTHSMILLLKILAILCRCASHPTANNFYTKIQHGLYLSDKVEVLVEKEEKILHYSVDCLYIQFD
jgi:hypothetical protein